MITVLYYTVQHLVGGSVKESQGNMKCTTLMYVSIVSAMCSATDSVSFNGQFHAWELFTGQCT